MASTASMKPVLLSTLLVLTIGLPASGAGESDEQFLYTGFTGRNIILDGAATITPGGLIELTNETFRIKGHAFHPAPMSFRRSPNGTVQSFSVSFVFGIMSSFGDIRGHGFTFFIAPSTDLSAAYSIQFLGLFNDKNNGSTSNHIFAVELDTIQNTEFGDIDNNHVGIDVNSLNSVNSSPAGFYNDSKSSMLTKLPLIGGGPLQIWVDYDMNSTEINVTLAPIGISKPVKPLLSTTYDLSTVITEQAYLGFSSSTGLSTGHHYVLGWSSAINGAAPTIDPTKLPKLPYLGPKPQSKLLEIVLPIASLVFVLAVGIVVVLMVKRHFSYKEVLEDWELEFGPYRFSYKDLFHATDGFHNKNLLGHGGFGKVYKSVLPVSKLQVAVKRLSHESKQGTKEFIAEVVSIGHLRHRNLVQLLGYCRRKGELLLVYEYMPNSSLDKYLYSEADKPTLDWAQRFRIIKGVASGIFYLHEEWEKVVIHRDIKASNVLLDHEMNGHLGDFGLARLYDRGTNLQTTHVAGTLGYIAPELARTGQASPLTDVYAFGIFILEVTCGQRPINNYAQDSPRMLVDWVVEHSHNGSLTSALDRRIQGNYDADEVYLVLKLGLLCAHPFCITRPTMRQVIQYLDGDMPLPELTPTNLSYSTLALMQNEGFDQYTSLPCTVGSNSMTFSLLSGR